MNYGLVVTDPSYSFFEGLSAAPESEYVKHVTERSARGFSRYDWFNFCDYLTYVFAKVCYEIIHDRQIVSETADKEAIVTVAKNYLNKYLVFQNDDDYMDFSSDSVVRDFLELVFPYLPVSPERYYTPTASPSVDRVKAGFSNEDMLVMRSYLTSIIVEGLNMFAGPLAHGYRGENEISWSHKILEMTYYLNILQAYFQNGKQLFIENFDAFWD